MQVECLLARCPNLYTILCVCVCVCVAVASTVKQALQDSLVQILQPKRRVDILRDVMEAQSQRRPFVITFCGVNGVGKSTNLAKVSCHC